MIRLLTTPFFLYRNLSYSCELRRDAVRLKITNNLIQFVFPPYWEIIEMSLWSQFAKNQIGIELDHALQRIILNYNRYYCFLNYKRLAVIAYIFLMIQINLPLCRHWNKITIDQIIHYWNYNIANNCHQTINCKELSFFHRNF